MAHQLCIPGGPEACSPLRICALDRTLHHADHGVNGSCVAEVGCYVCMHKELIPLDTFDVLGAGLLFLGGILAGASGIGGGGLNVPLLLLVLNFLFEEAVPISHVMVFGNAIAQNSVNAWRRHPLDPRRPLVDFDVPLILLPMQLLGNSFGVFLAPVVPTGILLTLACLVLLLAALKTIWRGVHDFGHELRTSSMRVLEQRASSDLSGMPDSPTKQVEDPTARLLPRDTPLSDHSVRIDAPAVPSHAAAYATASEAEPETEPEAKPAAGEGVGAVAGAVDNTREGVRQELGRRRRHSQPNGDTGAGQGTQEEGQEQIRSERHPDACIGAQTSSPTHSRSHSRSHLSATTPSPFFWPKLAALGAFWLLFVLDYLGVRLTRAKRCSLAHLFWQLGLVIAVALAVAPGAALARAAAARRTPLLGDIDWRGNCRLSALLTAALAIGVISGLLGLGGGELMAPLLLALGMLPQVASATSGFMVLFNASSNIVHYLSNGELAPFTQYAALAFGLGFGSALSGRLLAIAFVASLHHPSLVVFALGALLLLSMALLIARSTNQAPTWQLGGICQ